MPRQKQPKLKQRKDKRFRRIYHGKPFYGKTQQEADAKRDEYIRQEAAGEFKKKRTTVSEYALKWLPLHKGDVSTKCYNDYAKQLEALINAIGNKEIKDVTVDDAASVWYHYRGYSASTIKRAKMLYVALFEAAVENDLCRKNPFKARYAQPPKAKSGTHRTITSEEISLIRATPHRMQLASLIMLYAGLRRGEVLALEPKDIDLTTNTINVTKAVRFNSNRPIITKPKTSAGNRSVPILSALRPYLEELSQRPASMVNGDIMTDTAFRRAWDSYMLHLSKAAGHTIDIRPHDLRHTYCTMLRDAGVDMKQAMIWMGHSDEKMILHIYDHVSEKRTQNSIDQVEKMLLKVQNEVQNKENR